MTLAFSGVAGAQAKCFRSTSRPPPNARPQPQVLVQQCLKSHLTQERRCAPCRAATEPEHNVNIQGSSELQRRALLCAALAACSTVPSGQAATTDITHKIYFDIGSCNEALRADRRVGDKSALCDPAPVGRIVFGLYGNAAPSTVANFIRMMEEGVYNGTSFNKILAGQYVQAGKQGSKRMGRVDPRKFELAPNSDLVTSTAFSIPHLRPGTLSWCIGANEDTEGIKQDIEFKNTEFLITTGPGPVPSLDGQNIVFGQLLEGFDTLGFIVATPVIKVAGAMESYNAFANFIGDERAMKAKAQWGSPLKAVVITHSGVLA